MSNEMRETSVPQVRVQVLQEALATLINHCGLGDTVAASLQGISPIHQESLPDKICRTPAPDLKNDLQKEIDYFIMLLDSPPDQPK